MSFPLFRQASCNGLDIVRGSVLEERSASLNLCSMEDAMLERIAMLAPCVLIAAATACGGESLSTTGQDEQASPRAEMRGGVQQHGSGGADENGGGALRGSDIRGGGVQGAGNEGRGNEGRATGHERGWVSGRWAPGWGWSNGVWVVGGGSQYSCRVDDDCIGPLGRGVAICDFDPDIGLGQCVAPNW